MNLTEEQYAQLLAARRPPRQQPAPVAASKTGKLSKSRQSVLTAAEREIQATLCAYLQFRGIPFTVSNADQAFNQSGQQVRKLSPGWPDVTGCYQGRLLALEVKSANGRLRQAQAEMLERLWEAGAIVVIARCLEDLQVALAEGVHAPSKLEISRVLRGKSKNNR